VKEEELIPFQTSDIPEGPYLVFSPHPDDETLGMGGTIALATQRKIEVFVVVLTDGSEEGSAEERKAEAKAAASVLGTSRIDFWDIKDRELNKANLSEKGIRELIANLKPKCIFVPSPFEFHPDHRATYILVIEALNRTGYQGKIWTYEISRHGEADQLIDITPVLEIKKKAIACYKSQLLRRNYMDFTLALNRSRALTLPESVRYAEAFLSLEKEKALFAIENRTRSYLMDVVNPSPRPLVSIIIRTKDRPDLLQEALKSIAEQSYPNIEAVVVNDGGCDVTQDIAKYRQEIREIQYVDLERTMGRSAAANQGIKASKGEWIAFLDDDDLLTPMSIEVRISVGLRSGSEIVYGVVECHHYKKDSKDSPYQLKNKFLYNYPFDRDILLFQNLIPLNSLLFYRNIFDRHGLFDESYEMFEDWEFLIKLSRTENFFFINSLVGIYRIFSPSTTVTGDRFPMEKVLAHEEKIFQKYVAENISKMRLQKYVKFRTQEQIRIEIDLAYEQIEKLTKEIQTKDDEIEKLNREIQIRDENNGKLNHDCEVVRGQLHQIMTSRSWRLTEPLRSSMATLRKVFFYLKGLVAVDKDKKAGQQKQTEVLEKLSGKIPINDVTFLHECHPHTIHPLISIITDVSGAHPDHLKEMFDSVLSQCYLHWELCVAAVSQKDSKVGKILDEYEKKDSRIKVVFKKEKSDISDFSDTALSVSSGDYVAFLDSEDKIAPYALCEVVDLIEMHPDAKMIYADEIRIDENGKLTCALYKPGWSPETFLSTMYTGRFGIYKNSAVTEAGGIREEFEGAQFYDLALRISEKSDYIYHIPEILSFKRKSSSSPSHNSNSKSNVSKSGLKAIEEALNRRNAKGTVVPVKGSPGNFIVDYDLRANPLISIVIATKDNSGYLDRCLSSILRKTKYANFEVILVDNNSSEEQTFKVFRKWKQKLGTRLKIENLDLPFNFSKINNFGVSLAQGEIILLLNNDTEVITPFWLERMAGYVQLDEIGAVGATLLYPDKTIQHSGVVLSPEFIAGHVHKGLIASHPGYLSRLKIVFNYSAVTGACLMVKKKLYQDINGFDENLAVAFNDVDFCLKLLKSGYRNVVLPHVRLTHHESKTRGPEDTKEKQNRFIREKEMMLRNWKDYLLNDPFYNPNLTEIGEYFNIKY